MATQLKLLRLKINVTDDADFAGTQVAPAAGDQVTLVGLDPKSGGRTIDAIELVIEWLDVADAVVAGAGTLTLQLIPIFTRPPPLAGTIITGSAPFAATEGSRPIFITGVQEGDVLGVRLSAIVPPATTTQVRVMYREVRV